LLRGIKLEPALSLVNQARTPRIWLCQSAGVAP
jgi:hypothetical protein